MAATDPAFMDLEQTATRTPVVEAFFDRASGTVSYLVIDPRSRHCAIIDSVLDYDAKSGHTGTASAHRILGRITQLQLHAAWILETHIHADHLSAAAFLQAHLPAKLGIGANICQVQAHFGPLFHAEAEFCPDGRQFDCLFQDGECIEIGALTCQIWHTPGHTPACVSYLIGDAVFVGDTLFMPDYGTARCDFPGGDAHALYRSIRRILSLPGDTRMFLCHDYPAGERTAAWETTVAKQRSENIHIDDLTTEDQFVALRTARDATLEMPNLLLQSVQVNMRAGRFPPPEANGQRYLKIPIDALWSAYREKVTKPTVP